MLDANAHNSNSNAKEGNPLNAARREVKRSERHISNRLKSIAFDARRLEQKLCILEDVLDPSSDEGECSDSDNDSKPALHAKLSFFANLRCGDWYLPQKSYFRQRHALSTPNAEESREDAPLVGPSSCCYFKSSDGHYGKWAFSATRLNFQCLRHCLHPLESVLTLDEAAQVVTVIVDATQHGKMYPDSLSKTIPIWAMTMNSVYWRSQAPLSPTAGAGQLFSELFPPWLHPQEIASIEARRDTWEDVLRRCEVRPVSEWALSRPLKVVWLHASASDETWREEAHRVAHLLPEYHVIVAVCASGDASWRADPELHLGSDRKGWCYVPGAADDHSSWSLGLESTMFWDNVEELTDPTLSSCDVEDAVREVVQRCGSNARSSLPSLAPYSTFPVAGSACAWTLQCSINGPPCQSSGDSSSSGLGARVIWLCLHDTKIRRQRQGNMNLFDVESVASALCTEIIFDVRLDSRTTNFGIERSLQTLLSIANSAAMSFREEQDCENVIVRLCGANPVADLHLVGAVAVALVLYQKSLATSITKDVARIVQQQIVEKLGPMAVVRSDMKQVMRFFTSHIK